MSSNPENPEMQMILDKIDVLDSNIKDRFDAQEKYINMRLDNVEIIANKAHLRLDDHKKEITSLCDWRHQIIGTLWAVPFIITPFTALLTAWLLKIFNVFGA